MSQLDDVTNLIAGVVETAKGDVQALIRSVPHGEPYMPAEHRIREAWTLAAGDLGLTARRLKEKTNA